MNLYYFIFVWIALLAIVTMFAKIEVPITIDGKIEYRWGFLMAFVAFLPILYLATLGTPIGDTSLYLKIFDELPAKQDVIREYIIDANGGKGFIVFQYCIKKVFGSNQTAFRVILGLCHAIPVIYVFRRYSKNYLLTLFLFVASACHIGWMMNGLRQFLAVSIIFAATPLLIKKRYVPLLVIIGLASTIHTSALIMVPVVFIVQGKAWNKKTIAYIIVAIIAMYYFGKYTNLLDTFLVGTEYENATATWIELGDDGVNPIRVIVNSIPMFMSIIGLKYIDGDDNAINIMINMSIITTGLYLVAMTTSGIMIGRLPIYTSLYNCILLPYLVDGIFTKRSATMVSGIMILFYLVYYLFEVGLI